MLLAAKLFPPIAWLLLLSSGKLCSQLCRKCGTEPISMQNMAKNTCGHECHEDSQPKSRQYVRCCPSGVAGPSSGCPIYPARKIALNATRRGVSKL